MLVTVRDNIHGVHLPSWVRVKKCPPVNLRYSSTITVPQSFLPSVVHSFSMILYGRFKSSTSLAVADINSVSTALVFSTGVVGLVYLALFAFLHVTT